MKEYSKSCGNVFADLGLLKGHKLKKHVLYRLKQDQWDLLPKKRHSNNFLHNKRKYLGIR
jgi:hypothetical protein